MYHLYVNGGVAACHPAPWSGAGVYPGVSNVAVSRRADRQGPPQAAARPASHRCRHRPWLVVHPL